MLVRRPISHSFLQIEVAHALTLTPRPSSCPSGNASQVSDGAAAVLLVRRDLATKLGLKILGKFVTCAYAGVAPRVMGFVQNLLSPVFDTRS